MSLRTYLKNIKFYEEIRKKGHHTPGRTQGHIKKINLFKKIRTGSSQPRWEFQVKQYNKTITDNEDQIK